MARIFITGSADGLGQLAAQKLVTDGHRVVLHARNKIRAADAMRKVPGAEKVLVADLSSIAETKALAEEANGLGRFDAVVHNAGVYQVSNLELGAEGLPILLTVNTLAQYVLTCLMHRPKRLIYLSSGMHMHGDASLKALEGSRPKATYSDSKLHDLLLAKAVARKWNDVISNAVDPGWVPTKMGGAGAPDNLQKGYETQAWLAVSDDENAKVGGGYFHHQKEDRYLAKAGDIALQEKLLHCCERLSGVKFPG